jgi:hypothetical protein
MDMQGSSGEPFDFAPFDRLRAGRTSDDPSAGDLLRNIPGDWDMELLALIRLYH